MISSNGPTRRPDEFPVPTGSRRSVGTRLSRVVSALPTTRSSWVVSSTPSPPVQATLLPRPSDESGTGKLPVEPADGRT